MKAGNYVEKKFDLGRESNLGCQNEVRPKEPYALPTELQGNVSKKAKF